MLLSSCDAPMPDSAGHPTPAEVVAFRRRHGLRQLDLANLMGVHRRTIEVWEAGFPSKPPKMLALAMAAVDAGILQMAEAA